MVLFKLIRPFITNSKKRCPFIIGNRNEKVGNQEIPEVTGKFGFGEKMKQVKANRVLKENTLVIENTLFHNTTTLHTHHQVVNTKMRLIIFFAAENGDALYRQQKQDQELTVD